MTANIRGSQRPVVPRRITVHEMPVDLEYHRRASLKQLEIAHSILKSSASKTEMDKHVSFIQPTRSRVGSLQLAADCSQEFRDVIRQLRRPSRTLNGSSVDNKSTLGQRRGSTVPQLRDNTSRAPRNCNPNDRNPALSVNATSMRVNARPKPVGRQQKGIPVIKVSTPRPSNRREKTR